MELPGRSLTISRRALVIAAVLAAAVVLALVWGRGERTAAVRAAERGLVVEVLNGTGRSGRSGLARQVTRLLRQQGVDVIHYGSADLDSQVDSTVVLVRRGELARGYELARILGVARVESRPDTLRRVDCTVVLGMDYRFPKDWLPL